MICRHCGEWIEWRAERQRSKRRWRDEGGEWMCGGRSSNGRHEPDLSPAAVRLSLLGIKPV